MFNSNPIPKSSQNVIYPFLSKRIFSENQNDILISFTELRTQLRKYSASLPYKTGVYFEYLPSGTSIGVNEKEQFIPASLIKVPIVMAVYKKIEAGKLKKNDFISLEERFKDKTSGTLWQKANGTKLAVQDAIYKTLDDSDNTAKNILLSLLSKDELGFVFDSLDLDVSPTAEEEAVITPKNYSSILRSLYLSSYLNQTYSNEILETLSQSNNDMRLRSGIPNDVIVASKYGISYGANLKRSVYSDCGIIYLPKRPYLLCVMSEADEATAYAIMKSYAEITYNFVSKL